MADDLDDEWWQSEDVDEKYDNKEPQVNELEEDYTEEKISKSHSSLKKAYKEKLKRKLEEKEEGDKEPQETKELPCSEPKKKKQKRKGITYVLQNETPKPISSKELRKALKSHYEGKLSVIEKDEIKLKDKHFCECNDLSHTPTSYMKTVLPKWKKLKTSVGDAKASPLLLIITSSAIRATELIRQLADFRGENCKVAKLFAKHMKIDDQIKFLKSNVIHIGVGTPNRIYSLLENDHLKCDLVNHIILDWSWRDVKSKRLVDNKEIKTELMKLLRTFFIPLVKKQKTKFGLL